MFLSDLLKNKKMSIYRLSKQSGVPYATCNDLVQGRAQPEKCSAETIYKIAQALGVSMEDILAPYLVKRANFENFKSSVCHRVKELGDVDFIINTLKSGDIRLYFERKWYPESLYLLAMLDYLSRMNNVPLCEEYDDLRKCKLEKAVYPAGIIALSKTGNEDDVLSKAFNDSIPEFKRFNIIENEVRNVV